jgi:alpha-glucosidase
MERMGLNDLSKGWWRDAACYQVYVRSFADSDGDGIGDLPGITSRLPYLADLGVDALWITPFYPSPQNDHGYDVADYCDVEPLFGRLEDADQLIHRAHELGLRVIVDLVPNHTSDQHQWFQEALAAGPGTPERARYIFRDSETDSPPNNWQSVFGGPAWSRTPDGQWYLHLFDSTQPDLDWRNPEVHAMFEDVLRFWLGRGVDGFRIDVAHGLYKVESLPNQKDPTVRRIERMLDSAYGEDEPMWDQPEIHDVYRRWAEILDEFGPDGGRRGVGARQRVAGGVRPSRRARPGVQLLLAAGRLVRSRFRRGHPAHLRVHRTRRRLTHLGAQQPRRHPPPHEVRRRRARPRAGPRSDPHHAGAARFGLPLPG